MPRSRVEIFGAPRYSTAVRSRWRTFALVGLTALALDQWTKLLAVKHLTPGPSTHVIAASTGKSPTFSPTRDEQDEALSHVGPLQDLALFYGGAPSPCSERGARCPEVRVFDGFWNWRYAENRGAAWSIFSTFDDRVRAPFLIGVALFALGAITFYVRALNPEQRLALVGLSMVAGGALGNVIDRLRLGYVIDFIDWYAGTFHWATFNVADAAISTGIALLGLSSLAGLRRNEEPPPLRATANDSLAGPLP